MRGRPIEAPQKSVRRRQQRTRRPPDSNVTDVSQDDLSAHTWCAARNHVVRMRCTLAATAATHARSLGLSARGRSDSSSSTPAPAAGCLPLSNVPSGAAMPLGLSGSSGCTSTDAAPAGTHAQLAAPATSIDARSRQYRAPCRHDMLAAASSVSLSIASAPVLLPSPPPGAATPSCPRASTAWPPQNTARPQMLVLSRSAYEAHASSCIGGTEGEWGLHKKRCYADDAVCQSYLFLGVWHVRRQRKHGGGTRHARRCRLAPAPRLQLLEAPLDGRSGARQRGQRRTQHIVSKLQHGEGLRGGLIV